MTRQILGGKSKQEKREEFIKEYFEIFTASSLFGSGDDKEDMMMSFLSADNHVWDIDEVVLRLDTLSDLDKYEGKSEKIQSKRFKTYGFVFNLEFLHLSRHPQGIKASSGKTFFYSAADIEMIKDYQAVIEKMLGKEYDFFHAETVKQVTTKKFQTIQSQLDLDPVPGQTTVIIDNQIKNWVKDFDIDDNERILLSDGSGNIRAEFPQVFKYDHRTNPNAEVIWAREWSPYTQKNIEMEKNARRIYDIYEVKAADSECVGASCGRGCLVM